MLALLLLTVAPAHAFDACPTDRLWFDGRCRGASWFEANLLYAGAELVSVGGCTEKDPSCDAVLVQQIVDGELVTVSVTDEPVTSTVGGVTVTRAVPSVGGYEIAAETAVSLEERDGALYLVSTEFAPELVGAGVTSLTEQRWLSVGTAGWDVDVKACAVDGDFTAISGLTCSAADGCWYSENYCPDGGCLVGSDGSITVPHVDLKLGAPGWSARAGAWCRTASGEVEESIGWPSSSGSAAVDVTVSGGGLASNCFGEDTRAAQIGDAACEDVVERGAAAVGTMAGHTLGGVVGLISGCSLSLGGDAMVDFECDASASLEAFSTVVTTTTSAGAEVGAMMADDVCGDFGTDFADTLASYGVCDASDCTSSSSASFTVTMEMGGVSMTCNAELSAVCSSDGETCDCEATESPDNSNIDWSSCHD